MKTPPDETRPDLPTVSEFELSRRAFIEATGAALLVATALPAIHAQAPAAGPAISVDPAVPRSTIHVTVNGTRHDVEVEDRWTLAELLRDRLGMTGTKIGCDRGECGACTVLMDGRPVYACSNLALWMDGRQITTVEGLARDGVLDPLQQAFVDHDAPQCGFCTSGQLMSAKALLNSNPHPTDAEARAAMAGNLCRCANYDHYIDAVVAAGSMGAKKTNAGGAR